MIRPHWQSLAAGLDQLGAGRTGPTSDTTPGVCCVRTASRTRRAKIRTMRGPGTSTSFRCCWTTQQWRELVAGIDQRARLARRDHSGHLHDRQSGHSSIVSAGTGVCQSRLSSALAPASRYRATVTCICTRPTWSAPATGRGVSWQTGPTLPGDWAMRWRIEWSRRGCSLA